MLHEIFHLDFFMGLDDKRSQHVKDMSITYETTDENEDPIFVTDKVYDPLRTKMLARYVYPGFYFLTPLSSDVEDNLPRKYPLETAMLTFRNDLRFQEVGLPLL